MGRNSEWLRTLARGQIDGLYGDREDGMDWIHLVMGFSEAESSASVTCRVFRDSVTISSSGNTVRWNDFNKSDKRGSIPACSKRTFSSPQRPDRLRDPPSLLSDGCSRVHAPSQSTLHFRSFGLVLSLRARLVCRQSNDWQITSDFLWLHIKKAALCVWSADYVVSANPKEHRLRQVTVNFLQYPTVSLHPSISRLVSVTVCQ